ncbi:hypothetical protein [Nostocoides sp. HKS02]|uniref:hypothetical protein n=1 Tax=Nostocoides sp. HKS02 TaxID=1813880 RepID=UPI0012B4D272|nr:hypothetical protein [Tetrasphaera sp. HKS02]QGN58144.1 hypothetical protein GKE56_09885 [Tetrasphaera sp. HKS02]
MTDPAPVNVTALFAEAASKSGLLWVDVPGDRAWPFWHAWSGEVVYAVSGPGEQTLPWIPERVRLIARSKDTGGRLLTVEASSREITPTDEEWQAATDALKAERLNATDDLVSRWAQVCTVRAFRPFGAPVEAPRLVRHHLRRGARSAERGDHHGLASVALARTTPPQARQPPP